MNCRLFRQAVLVFAVAVAALAGASSAAAKEPGTHFILEGQAGTGLTDAALVSWFGGAAFGYGGRVGGTPLRFYGIISYGRGFVESDLRNTAQYATRALTDDVLVFGPRLYIPVARNVRLFFQLQGGFAWTAADWRLNDIEEYRVSDSRLATEIGGGIQARLARWFSLGFGFDRLSYWGDETDATAAAFAGFTEETDDADQFRCMGMVLVHF